MVRHRLAIVETYPVRSGEEGAALSMARRESEIARALNRRNLDTHCFRTIRSLHPSKAFDGEVGWNFSPVDADSLAEADPLTRSTHLIESLRDYSPDIILVKGVGTVMSSELLKLKIPIRLAIIGGAHQTAELARYHLVLVETPAQHEFLKPRIGAKRLVLFPKYASSEFFEMQRTVPPSIDILTVGRLIPLKNLSLLATLPPNGYQIAICGDGPLRSELQAKLDQTGNSVAFVGHLPTTELAATLGRARILAHPSRSEGLPRAVVEAMAAGTPAVFLDGVIDSPILDSSNSLRTSTESFSEDVRRLLDNDERLEQLSIACRLTAQREFSPERLEAAVHDLTERLNEIGAQGPVSSLGTAFSMKYHRVRWAIRNLPHQARARLSRWRRRFGGLIRRARRILFEHRDDPNAR